MTRLLLIAVMSLLTLTQCKTTKKPENETTTKVETTTKTETKDAPATKNEPKTPPPEGKKYTQGQENGPSNNVLEFFSTDYWLPQFAVSGLSKDAHLPYQGMWLKFDKSGQFKGGINDTDNIRGSWRFDTKSNHLFIISNNPDLEGKWQVNRSGFAMVWFAREGQKLQDIQIKLVNSSYKPGEE
ncbi:MAG TPA: hypothetical protein ENK85_08240 [Saprospiraceae bacterium]|nr:hypothetical protein [Saprospiraceae bacterium]